MINKKRCVLCAVLCVAVIFAGCGGRSEDNTNDEDDASTYNVMTFKNEGNFLCSSTKNGKGIVIEGLDMGKLLSLLNLDAGSSDSNVSDANKNLLAPDFMSEYRIVIPNKIKGLPVVEIAGNAFAGNSNVVYIEFPDTLKKIGEGAFMGCSALETVIIPKKVGHIDFGFLNKNAFEGCKAMSVDGQAALRRANYKGNF